MCIFILGCHSSPLYTILKRTHYGHFPQLCKPTRSLPCLYAHTSSDHKWIESCSVAFSVCLFVSFFSLSAWRLVGRCPEPPCLASTRAVNSTHNHMSRGVRELPCPCACGHRYCSQHWWFNDYTLPAGMIDHTRPFMGSAKLARHPVTFLLPMNYHDQSRSCCSKWMSHSH